MSYPDYPEMPSPVYIRKAHEELLVAEKSATASKWMRRGLGFAAATAILGLGGNSDQATDFMDNVPTELVAGGVLATAISSGEKKKREPARYGVVAARIAPPDVEKLYKVD